MECKPKWRAVNISWTTSQLVQYLEIALSLCSATDVVLSATEGRDKSLPFTEYSILQCDDCGAICDDSEQYLVHTLKCKFDEAYLMLYRRLGMIPRRVQRDLDKNWERSSSMVGRALQNNQEICVFTPLVSPLAPFMLNGVTVSTCEPKCRNTYAKAMVEGPCMKSVPVYFCVRAVRRRFDEITKYATEKGMKRRYRELKRSLKSFTIDVPDLLEYPPEDPEDAWLLHQATGLPIGTAIIPARKIHLRIPTFSISDLYTCSAVHAVSGVSKLPVVKAFNIEDVKPKIDSRTSNCEKIVAKKKTPEPLYYGEKPSPLSSIQPSYSSYRFLKRKRCGSVEKKPSIE